MSLSGLEIFKLLPKTNCGDCSVPTCMAFAMKLAQKKAELSECPHASEEAKTTLGAASEPPIRLVKIGGDHPFEAGNETVMFRHEKTFFHPTGIAVQIRTSDAEDIRLAAIKEVEAYVPERVGEQLKIDLFFITHDGKEKSCLLDTVKQVQQYSTKAIILDCPDEAALEEALTHMEKDRPAIFQNKMPSPRVLNLAKDSGAAMILTAETLDKMAESVEAAKNAGIKDILLNVKSHNLGTLLQNNTIMRRSALKANVKSFGYPLFCYLDTQDRYDLTAKAAMLICKYGSLIVLPEYDKALLYALLTLRQNIYTDPQKPIQVDAKVYPIGEPTPDSPVFVTTNFSLTYFIVSGEIENSGISAHLVVTDVEGQSVLTAWAAGKFVGDKIAAFIKGIDLESQVKTRKIIIPGFVAQISGDLEENLPGWEVIVGCQEASDIPSFIKSVELT